MSKWQDTSSNVAFDKDMIAHIGKKLLILFGYAKDIYEDPRIGGMRLERSRSEINCELFNIYDLLKLSESKNFQSSHKEDLAEFIKIKKKDGL